MSLLTDTFIRSIKLSNGKNEAAYCDGNGLYLIVRNSLKSKDHLKSWKLKYKRNNKLKSLQLGKYPEITLKRARSLIANYKELLANGEDPQSHNIKQKHKALKDFNSIADSWLNKRQKDGISDNHLVDTTRRLKRIKRVIGHRDVSSLEPLDIINFLRTYEENKSILERDKVKSVLHGVFKYAISLGICKYNPCSDISEALQKGVKKPHYSCITDPQELALLLNDIDQLNATYPVMLALRLAPFVMLRPIELTALEWEEVNFTKQQLIIKAQRMKMRKTHIVPLSRQALEIILQAKSYSLDNSPYVFASSKSWNKPIGIDALSKALRNMGYTYNPQKAQLPRQPGEKTKHVTHGFRGTASTLLNEMKSKHNWHTDTIEKQLAHGEKNKIRDAYNHAEYLEERTSMMQIWADYLDQLKYGNDIIPIEQQKQKA